MACWLQAVRRFASLYCSALLKIMPDGRRQRFSALRQVVFLILTSSRCIATKEYPFPPKFTHIIHPYTQPFLTLGTLQAVQYFTRVLYSQNCIDHTNHANKHSEAKYNNVIIIHLRI